MFYVGNPQNHLAAGCMLYQYFGTFPIFWQIPFVGSYIICDIDYKAYLKETFSQFSLNPVLEGTCASEAWLWFIFPVLIPRFS